MTRAFTILILLFFIYSNPLTAQDFTAVDQHAMNLKAEGDVAAIAAQLTTPFSTELEKARAIYTYVATSMEYDCKEFHRSPEDRKARTREEILDRALEKNLGVCAGYAILFDALCKAAGLNSEYVRGYARLSPRAPAPDRLRPNHAWNVVQIDGKWQLVDATWSSGYSNPEVTKFTAAFDDYYFMTPPEKFFQRHWPEEAQWQLMETEQSAEDFVAQPHFSRLQSGWRINDFSPREGTLSDDEDAYTFRIQLTGPEKVFFTMGSRRFEMEKDAEGYYSYSLAQDEVRGRKFVIMALQGSYLWSVVEYRLGG